MPSFAKTTAPRLSGIHPNERLFKLLDEAHARPAIWIQGPPGAGKTTLVASYLKARLIEPLWDRLDDSDADLPTFFHYLAMAAGNASPRHKKRLPALTPEYRDGLPAFTRHYFRNLFERLKRPFVLVFDDYHDVPPESLLNDLLPCALEEIPEAGRVIVISRCGPPEQVSRLRANGLLQIIGPAQLKLTSEEIKGVAAVRGANRLSDADVRRLEERTQGWAAGLVLMLEANVSDGRDDEALAADDPQRAFGYLATEIFRRMKPNERDVLLACSFLPSTSARMAEHLTGDLDAGSILEALHRRGYFVSRDVEAEPAYRCHPLLREFLLATALDTWSADRIAAVRRRGAGLLESAGQVEPAVELFRAAADWPAIAAIVVNWAPALIEQGRHLTIDGWTKQLPLNLLESDAWLCYRSAEASLPFEPAQSQPKFEKAFALFRSSGDRAGLLLSWAGITSAIRFNVNADLRQLDGWIATLEALLAEDAAFPSNEIEFQVAFAMYSALQGRMPWHEQFDAWKQRALTMARSAPRNSHRIAVVYAAAIYELIFGNLAAARILLDSAPPVGSPDLPARARMMSYVAHVYGLLIIGHNEKCLETVAVGLAASRACGVHIWDFVLRGMATQAAMQMDDLAAAERWLREMSAATNVAVRGSGSQYHRYAGSLALLRGDLPAAREHAETSLALGAGLQYEDFFSHGLLCDVFHQSGDFSAAKQHADAALAIGLRTKSPALVYTIRLLEARLAFDRKDDAAGLAALESAMALGREHGYSVIGPLYPSGLSPARLAGLCARALQSGIERGYVCAVIRAQRLVAPSQEIEGWPWPIKVYTLGTFALLQDDCPLPFSRKAPRKPLALLKAIIAFGGKGVSETALAEALWPAQDGDAASAALTSALHRLRKILGDDDAILVNEGRLTLNANRCWVDVWAFQRWVRRAEEAVDAGDLDLQRRIAEQLLLLYRGGFLPADTEEPWTVSLRERLHSLFMRHMLRLARRLHEAGHHAAALACYARGVEADPLAEEFYQGLMHCHLSQGRPAEGLAVFRRLRQALSVTLSVAPSAASEALHQSLLKPVVAS